MQVSQWLKHASLKLAEHESARLDADLLMCYTLQCERTSLYARPEQTLTEAQLDQLNLLLTKRERGAPIAYLLEQQEFWSLDFEVSKDVLVPRSDTEVIVELALQALPDKHSTPIIDAGTGSGAIATAVTHQWQSDNSHELTMVASDVSVAALQLAQRNARRHQLHSINFVRSNWLQAFTDNSFGMIISNPPYLASNDPHLNNTTLQHEPIDALVSGNDGLDAIRTLITDACRAGQPGCYVLLEHGATQAHEVQTLMRQARYTDVQTHKDIAELDRVSCGYCPVY